MGITTIQLDNRLKEKLENLKIHNRETYNEVISRLLQNNSPQIASRESLIATIEILSDPKEMREIAEGLRDIEAGRTISLEKLKKELKL